MWLQLSPRRYNTPVVSACSKNSNTSPPSPPPLDRPDAFTRPFKKRPSLLLWPLSAYWPCSSGASLIMSSMRSTVIAASVANWIILTFDMPGSKMPALRLFWILPEMQSMP